MDTVIEHIASARNEGSLERPAERIVHMMPHGVHVISVEAGGPKDPIHPTTFAEFASQDPPRCPVRKLTTSGRTSCPPTYSTTYSSAENDPGPLSGRVKA